MNCIHCNELAHPSVEPSLCLKCINERLQPLAKILFKDSSESEEFNLPSLDIRNNNERN